MVFKMAIEWERAKELYRRGIITQEELGQCGIEHIKTAKNSNEGLFRAAEVDAFFDSVVLKEV